MNNYKFRGKRKDWDKWVYGSLIVTPQGTFILEEGDSVEYNEPEYDKLGMGCGLEDRNITDRYEAMQHGFDKAVEKCCELYPAFIEVIPETVGMWTGWNDNHGNEIYADDTLQGNLHEQERDNGSAIVSNVQHKAGGFEVFSRAMSTAFGGNDIDRFCWCDQGYHGRANSYWQIDNIEIIGNIHDVNPASGTAGINNMFDPNQQQQEATSNEQATNEQVATAEQDAQENAMESAEEGGAEG